MSVTWREHKKL